MRKAGTSTSDVDAARHGIAELDDDDDDDDDDDGVDVDHAGRGEAAAGSAAGDGPVMSELSGPSSASPAVKAALAGRQAAIDRALPGGFTALPVNALRGDYRGPSATGVARWQAAEAVAADEDWRRSVVAQRIVPALSEAWTVDVRQGTAAEPLLAEPVTGGSLPFGWTVSQSRGAEAPAAWPVMAQ
uniref:Uncharacterized protein n=1 Tax=Cafeteria roenbergensis TaxID=33653 RepID=A0A7S0JV33_CAFRO